jgi:hypothetical protein
MNFAGQIRFLPVNICLFIFFSSSRFAFGPFGDQGAEMMY